MKRISLSALFCAAMTALAELPSPLFTSAAPPEDAGKTLAALDAGELACAFWVKFDTLPSKGAPTGLFELSADKDGLLTLTLGAKRTAMVGDFTCRTKTPVKAGEWHHVAFNYSLMMQRAAFYLDDHLQYENDTIYLPKLALGEPTVGKNFGGAVRDFRVYDIALTSDYLLMARDIDEGLAAVRADARAALAAAGNASLKTWATALLKRADAMKAASATTTVRELAELRRDAAAALRLSRELPAAKGDVASGPVTAYTVDPFGQERLMPYELPENGRLSGVLDVVAAQGEYEDGSLYVVALQPVKSFTIKVSELKCGARAFPSENIDVKLVKRWWRCGGAWLSYHRDGRQRILAPHLLVNDDALIKVDELRTRNYLRLDYPEGTIYADVSDPASGQHAWHSGIPFRDAKTLQPIASLTEPGRNQQYVFTVHAPENAEPGIYTGTINLLADGKKTGAVTFRIRVLPFALPAQPASYDNLGQVYFSHMNSLPASDGLTYEERLESVRESMENIRAHGMNHTSGLYSDKIRADMALKAGFIPDYIFGAPRFNDWRTYFPGVPSRDLTLADKELGLQIAKNENRAKTEYYRKMLPGAIPMVLYYSESAAFQPLNVAQAEQAQPAHEEGWQVFAHGSRKNLPYAGDIQDMTSDTAVERSLADEWHAAGGAVIAYAQPFAAPENPAIHRRRIGFERYKGAHYDGNMQHGFKTGRVPFNEFADDPGGDGSYRCTETAMPQYGGALYALAWDAVREAYDDIRYATLLKQTAMECLGSSDEQVRREAKRQLIWLEQRDGYNTDLAMLRLAMVDRILTLKALQK